MTRAGLDIEIGAAASGDGPSSPGKRSTGEEQESYRRLIELLPDAVIVMIDGAVVFANQSAAEFLGAKDATGLMERQLADLVTAEGQRHLRSMRAEIGASGTASHVRELACGTLTGGTTLGEFQLHKIEWCGKQAELAVIRSRRHGRSGEAADESVSLLWLIADSLPARITYVDRNERFKFVNKAALDWFGLPREAVVGRTVCDVFGETIYTSMRARVARALRGQSVSYQTWTDHPVFGSRFIRLHYLSDVGPDGSVRGYVHIAADITEEKKAQALLVEAKELAEKANADKSAFLRAAGHDLRQPAQAIGLLCYALSEYVTAPAGRAILDDLDRAVRGMHSVLGGVLGFSQLEDGNVEPYVTDFPLSEVFDQMQSEFDLQARQKKIDLRIVKSRQFVRSDVALLNRIVQNLVSNAVKYTQTGRVLLGARRSGARIRVEVWDTGPGIPENELGKIFHEFYQVRRSDSYHTGLGLGLAIVERTAKLLGHEIVVTSRLGHGTMFAAVVEPAECPADLRRS